MREETRDRFIIAGLAALSGYVVSRALYELDYMTVGGDWQEIAFTLVAPVAIALALQLLTHGRNHVFCSASFAAVACAYVAGKQVLLLDHDWAGEAYAKAYVQVTTWVFSAGMVLPWVVARLWPDARRDAEAVSLEV